MRRELCATVDRDQVSVTAEPTDDGRWRVRIDGREQLVDARQVRPGTWSLLIDGRSWLVDLDARKSGTVALVGATETPIALEDARRKRLAEVARRDRGEAGGAAVVGAPIAGKVVKLLVAPSASVSEGDGLVVLEAMKMENEIRAPRAGRVARIHVAAGQSVETQEPLLTLE
jgi:biotin carboxyl carrier protein